MYYRNAGGVVKALQPEIKGEFTEHPKITALEITVHRDCGGIKAAAAILDGADLNISIESLTLFEETFVKYFRGHGFEGASTDQQKMKRMEEFNRDLQESQAREILRQSGREDVQVNAQLVSVPTGLHVDTVIVVMGRLPNTMLDKNESVLHIGCMDFRLLGIFKDDEIAKLSGLGKGHAYVIMAETVDGASPSLELAVKVMGKRSIVFIPSSASEQKKVDELCKKPYMNGITPKIIPGYSVKKKMPR
ncbi:MAG: hypothetical protein ACYCO0_04720 [Candidatus Micrarchaeaceae archaeon]